MNIDRASANVASPKVNSKTPKRNQTPSDSNTDTPSKKPRSADAAAAAIDNTTTSETKSSVNSSNAMDVESTMSNNNNPIKPRVAAKPIVVLEDQWTAAKKLIANFCGSYGYEKEYLNAVASQRRLYTPGWSMSSIRQTMVSMNVLSILRKRRGVDVKNVSNGLFFDPSLSWDVRLVNLYDNLSRPKSNKMEVKDPRLKTFYASIAKFSGFDLTKSAYTMTLEQLAAKWALFQQEIVAPFLYILSVYTEEFQAIRQGIESRTSWKEIMVKMDEQTESVYKNEMLDIIKYLSECVTFSIIAPVYGLIEQMYENILEEERVMLPLMQAKAACNALRFLLGEIKDESTDNVYVKYSGYRPELPNDTNTTSPPAMMETKSAELSNSSNNPAAAAAAAPASTVAVRPKSVSPPNLHATYEPWEQVFRRCFHTLWEKTLIAQSTAAVSRKGPLDDGALIEEARIQSSTVTSETEKEAIMGQMIKDQAVLGTEREEFSLSNWVKRINLLYKSGVYDKLEDRPKAPGNNDQASKDLNVNPFMKGKNKYDKASDRLIWAYMGGSDFSTLNHMLRGALDGDVKAEINDYIQFGNEAIEKFKLFARERFSIKPTNKITKPNTVSAAVAARATAAASVSATSATTSTKAMNTEAKSMKAMISEDPAELMMSLRITDPDPDDKHSIRCACRPCQKRLDSRSNVFICNGCNDYENAVYCSQKCRIKHWREQHWRECDRDSIRSPESGDTHVCIQLLP